MPDDSAQDQWNRGTRTGEFGATAPAILILGSRGIPAAYGGFETFAERLALYLVARGWRVGVYCQNDVDAVRQRFRTEHWKGVELIQIEVAGHGPSATLLFDAYTVLDAARRDAVCLVLGYNSAVLLPYLRLWGRKVLTNMDGIEWRRPKWSRAIRAWFWVNEWIAAWSSQRLIADHPKIADHLATRRPRRSIVTIPYGGDPIAHRDPAPLARLGLTKDGYLVSIARIEPDNNILAIVQAFSRKRRDCRLVVVGGLDGGNAYHAAIRAAASDEVIFTGAIYDPETVAALRGHARAYLHGHTVGGTNPSLVEALWAGNAVLAHDNAFNRGTAGASQLYFTDVDSCERGIEMILRDDVLVARARAAALTQASEHFVWDDILRAYEAECLAAWEKARRNDGKRSHAGNAAPEA